MFDDFGNTFQVKNHIKRCELCRRQLDNRHEGLFFHRAHKGRGYCESCHNKALKCWKILEQT